MINNPALCAQTPFFTNQSILNLIFLFQTRIDQTQQNRWQCNEKTNLGFGCFTQPGAQPNKHCQTIGSIRVPIALDFTNPRNYCSKHWQSALKCVSNLSGLHGSNGSKIAPNAVFCASVSFCYCFLFYLLFARETDKAVPLMKYTKSSSVWFVPRMRAR